MELSVIGKFKYSPEINSSEHLMSFIIVTICNASLAFSKNSLHTTGSHEFNITNKGLTNTKLKQKINVSKRSYYEVFQFGKITAHFTMNLGSTCNSFFLSF